MFENSQICSKISGVVVSRVVVFRVALFRIIVFVVVMSRIVVSYIMHASIQNVQKLPKFFECLEKLPKMQENV